MISSVKRKIYDSKKVPLEGEIRKRKSNGLCGYLSLDQTDDDERAEKRREANATWIKDNPNVIIGKYSAIDHIKYDIGQITTSEACYNHMHICPLKNTTHRQHQLLSTLEIIVDCILTNCSVYVCAHGQLSYKVQRNLTFLAHFLTPVTTPPGMQQKF